MSDWTFAPTQLQIESTNVWRMMRRLGFEDVEAFLRYSREEPSAFWSDLAGELGIEWFTPYQEVIDSSRGIEWTQWFTGGKLNITHNTLDRHVSDRVAVVSETEDGTVRSLTFADLAREVNRVAH